MDERDLEIQRLREIIAELERKLGIKDEESSLYPLRGKKKASDDGHGQLP